VICRSPGCALIESEFIKCKRGVLLTCLGEIDFTMEVRLVVLLVSLLSAAAFAKSNRQRFTGFKNVLTVSEIKEWKKVLKTRNNVLALFADGRKPVSEYLALLENVAGEVRGKGSLVFVDCSDDAKKMCKKLKVQRTNGYAFKHYKSGSFHKDYDRLMTVDSIISFMKDPSADPPWYEDPEASSVRHVLGPQDLEALLRTEKKPILMFFYAPWCGHCKRMKPELAAAAADLQVQGKFVLAGMNVDNPENFQVREHFNITGFPTILYFEDGVKQFEYGGELVAARRNLRPASVFYFVYMSSCEDGQNNLFSPLEAPQAHLVHINNCITVALGQGSSDTV